MKRDWQSNGQRPETIALKSTRDAIAHLRHAIRHAAASPGGQKRLRDALGAATLAEQYLAEVVADPKRLGLFRELCAASARRASARRRAA